MQMNACLSDWYFVQDLQIPHAQMRSLYEHRGSGMSFNASLISSFPPLVLLVGIAVQPFHIPSSAGTPP